MRRRRVSVMDKERWNSIVAWFPQSTILQTWQWGAAKRITGWEPDYYVRESENGDVESASLILCREQKITRCGPTLKILYLPNGPLLNWSDGKLVRAVLDDLNKYARIHKAAYIKVDPQAATADNWMNKEFPHAIISDDTLEVMKKDGWRDSAQQIQFKNTFWIDLTPTENDLLMGMKQKTRYNIRLSQRKGIRIHKGGVDDLDLLYNMYLETSVRDGFIIRPRAYYLDVWASFVRDGLATPLIATWQDEPLAALILFHFAKKSFYLYGMSTEQHREKMPNYLLQWEAIRESKRLGCEVYDLWGAPDVFNESDRMWGVYRFKEGLGARVIETIGAYDYPTSPIAYTIIQNVLPVFQSLSRRLRRKQMLEELGQG